MALQGTLETFALADVLRLLASTKKTGNLRIEGDRGAGELGVLDGELVSGSATKAPLATKPADVLFELLRYADGSFVFDSDATVAGDHRDGVDAALAEAEEQLREWREIEAVVPSPTRLVTLLAERGDRDITLSAAQWGAVVAVGSGCTTLALGERLGLPELPATRLVRDLVELGAVAIGDEVAAEAPPRPTAPEPARAPEPVATPEPVPASEPVSAPEPPVVAEPVAPYEPAPAFEASPPSLQSVPDPVEAPAPPPPPVAPPAAPNQGISFADAPSFISEPDPGPAPGPSGPLLSTGSSSAFAPPSQNGSSAFAPAPAAFAPAPAETTSGWDDDPDDGLSSFHDDHDSAPRFDGAAEAPGPDDPFGPDPFSLPKFPSSPDESREAEEMARQLANLSPRAQQAVAAAAAANSDEEREQAIARVEQDSDEPINRNLLLKYLSSVDDQ